MKEFNALLNIKIRKCNSTVELLTRCANLIKLENGLDSTKQSLDQHIITKTAVIILRQQQDVNELDLQCNSKAEKGNKCHSSMKILLGTYHCIKSLQSIASTYIQ